MAFLDTVENPDCASPRTPRTPRTPHTPRTPQTPMAPEELRCPSSLQIMSEPVIVASGQIYERVCIEKRFRKRHATCPKTRQDLAHLNLTLNYCVKGLVASWCEARGIRVPSPPSPPPSPCSWGWEFASEAAEVEQGEVVVKLQQGEAVKVEQGEAVKVEQGEVKERPGCASG